MADGRVEVITGRERRRRWSVEQKLRIVAEAEEPGICVRAVAARHDVYPSLLHYWRRQVREGRLAAPASMGFVPVRVSEATQPMPGVLVAAKRTAEVETVEILLSDGCCVRFGNAVSRPLLRDVITMLRQ